MSDTGPRYGSIFSSDGQDEHFKLERYAQKTYILRTPFTANSLMTNLRLNSKTFPPRLDYDNEVGFFDRKRTWNLKSVEAALCDGLDPNIFWTKDDLISSKGTSFQHSWTQWNTPLHLAICASDQDSAEAILRYGGDVNIYNYQGHTAIHEAIDHQGLDNLSFLIRHGADPNKPSRDGHVPLHLALRDGDEILFLDLLQKGAKLQAAGHFEWSIADLALLASDREILAILMSDKHALLPTPMLTRSKSCHLSQPSNFAAAASKLLAVSCSNRVLPPEDLYETYLFLFHSLQVPTHPSWDAEAVNSLIENFTAGLYKASNIPSLATTERFCSACLTFQSLAAQSCRGPITGRDHCSRRIEIHRNKAELEECALGGCSLCALVADWVYDRQFFGKSCPHPESSPITLEVCSGIRPPLSGPRRVDSVSAQLANVEHLPDFFWLQELDMSLGRQEDDSSDTHSTGSSRALGVAWQWLEDCRTSPAHFRCQEAYRKILHGPLSPLPTRVLHVGSDHQDPHLFESNGIKASYCILSYCWGRSGNAITTKTNISERIKGIALASLPTLLREAVLAARALGFAYIWIDALCIIQDDEEDWAREASVMHELYSRADLTITSLVAGDSTDRLFQPRPRRICRPIPLNLGLMLPKRDRPRFKEESVVQLAVHPGQMLAGKTTVSGPVHQRAWTLQEQTMSTRVLYFGAGLLHWECLHVYHLESSPNFAKDSSRDIRTNRQRKLVIKGLPSLKDRSSGSQDPFEVWQAQVQEFTRRQLTKPSDRIPAFLAISKSIASVLKDEFVGGIWKGDDHLLESLCWRMQQPDATDPRGPTWTWASRSGEASYDLLQHEGKKTRKAVVVSCDAAADKSQSQVFGSITLKGTLKFVQYDFSRVSTRPGTPDYVFSDHASGAKQKGCCCVFDMIAFGEPPPEAPAQPSGPYVHVHYAPRPKSKKKGRIRLLLQPINGNGDFRAASAFRRVGIEFRPWQLSRRARRQADKDYMNNLLAGLLDHESNERVSPQPSDEAERIGKSITSTIEDKVRPEETSTTSEDDDPKYMETFWSSKIKEVQTNRIVTIF